MPAAVPSASPESPASPARPATRATPASTASSAPASGAHFTGFERKKIVWEVISVACVVAFVTLAAINLLLSGRLSWALYPLASLALVWLLSSAVLLMHHRPVPGILLAVISPPLFLVAIDAIDGPLLWSYELAVPIALLVEIVVAAFAIAVRRARRKGINLIAFALIGASAICLGIEGGLDLYVDARISLGWSAITALSLVPIAVFLLYLHHRVVRTANLRRLFRL